MLGSEPEALQTRGEQALKENGPFASRPYDLAFFLLLAGFEVLVFSLPLFPTGDGGLHLYYASIFRDLLTHQQPSYAHFYTIRHAVQPYVVHYYGLITLFTFVSADMAEKMLVGGGLAVFALGFRSASRALSPASPGLALWAFPFLLNWPLAMGALNYVFGIGLMFFALGTYQRLLRPGHAGSRWGTFVAWLLLLILAHPVPLLLLLGILALDLFAGLWNTRDRALWRPRARALALACLAFLVPVLTADRAAVGQSTHDVLLHTTYFHELASAKRLNMFVLPGMGKRLYKILCVLVLPVSLVWVFASGFLGRLKARSLTPADRLAVFTAVFLLVILFAPSEMNGSSYFALRLFLPCWLCGLAALSGTVRGAFANRLTAIAATAFACVALVAGFILLPPVAARSAAIEQAPLPREKVGLLVESHAAHDESLIHMEHAVFFWSGARAFAAHGDVLLNSAWLQLTIMPIQEKGKAGLLRDYTEKAATENPTLLLDYFDEHPAEKLRALQSADFVLFVDPDPNRPDPQALANDVLAADLVHWSCEGSGAYRVCSKRR